MSVSGSGKKSKTVIIIGGLVLALFTYSLYFGVSDAINTHTDTYNRDVKIEQHPATVNATVTNKYVTYTYTVGKPTGRWTSHYFVQYALQINATPYSDTEELTPDYGAYLAIGKTIPLKYDTQDPSFHTVNKLQTSDNEVRNFNTWLITSVAIMLGSLDAICIWAWVRYIVRKPIAA